MARAMLVMMLLAVAVPPALALGPAPVAQPLPSFDTTRYYDQARFDARAVASLEQSVRLQPATEAILALMEAYAMVGAVAKYNALTERVSSMAQPVPIK